MKTTDTDTGSVELPDTPTPTPTPLPSCSYCHYPIHRDQGTAHFGTHSAHRDRQTCVDLLANELAITQAELTSYLTASRDLTSILRDSWPQVVSNDNLSLFLTALVCGIAESWKSNPPVNGFTTALKFTDPEIGTLEVDIRRITGKTAAETIQELCLAVMNQTGDNLCWLKDNDPLRILVNGQPQIPPRDQFLESCSRFHSQISGERGELSGCQTIAQLESNCARLTLERDQLQSYINDAIAGKVTLPRL